MNLIAVTDRLVAIANGSYYILVFIGGSICMFLTFLGSLPALLGTKISQRTLDIGLGFSAGIMLVASFTSLILPAIEVGGILKSIVGFVLGSLAIHIVDKLLPHEHLMKGFEGPETLRKRLKAVWLLVFTIIIHNFPEGLAVGSGILYDPKSGMLLAVAIGIQDIPEGFAVSVPLVGMGMSRARALLIGLLSGLVELAMAFVPLALLEIASTLLPYMLGFAGGAMIYVVSHEVIPETHRYGHEDWATLGLLLGFIVMLVLDTMLG